MPRTAANAPPCRRRPPRRPGIGNTTRAGNRPPPRSAGNRPVGFASCTSARPPKTPAGTRRKSPAPGLRRRHRPERPAVAHAGHAGPQQRFGPIRSVVGLPGRRRGSARPRRRAAPGPGIAAPDAPPGGRRETSPAAPVAGRRRGRRCVRSPGKRSCPPWPGADAPPARPRSGACPDGRRPPRPPPPAAAPPGTAIRGGGSARPARPAAGPVRRPLPASDAGPAGR